MTAVFHQLMDLKRFGLRSLELTSHILKFTSSVGLFLGRYDGKEPMNAGCSDGQASHFALVSHHPLLPRWQVHS